MTVVKAKAIVIVVTLVAALMGASASAQQPASATPQPTPAALLNPNWCSQVPASPPPPYFEHHPGAWAAERQMCMNLDKNDRACASICINAIDRWNLQKAGRFNQPDTFPSPTDQPQGPFPLPGGANGYILPVQPAPAPGGPTSDAADAISAALGSVLPPGPFSSFPGQDLNALVDASAPDVAADVSPTQNAEFTDEYKGLYVWNKPVLPIQSPPTPLLSIPNDTFWCGSNGVNGQPLPGCVSGVETFGLLDTQIGYDATLGRWLVTEQVGQNPTTGANYVFFAASTTSTLSSTGRWNKWSIAACTTNPLYPKVDQPLLGWSTSLVVVDITCAHVGFVNFGPDEIFVIPNSTITSASNTLPAAIVAPCTKMVPARDEQGSFPNAFLLASIVPGSGLQNNDSNCAPTSSNTGAYVVEYNANTAGVFGNAGCAAGTSGCSPVSISPQWGSTQPTDQISPADQLGCGGVAACEINLGGSRIKAAQIRPTNISGVSTPILAAGFATGVAAGSPGPESQNLWFIQNPSSGSWLDHISFAGGSQWYAFPTIAIDGDQEFYLGSTQFTSTSYPSTIWDSYVGIPGAMFMGQNFIETSTQEYLGNPPKQSKWGDFNTMIYDANAIPPGGEGSWWSVEETTCPNASSCSNGTSDESTNWVALADPTPLPYFVGYNVPTPPAGQGPAGGGENECPNGTGYYCNLTYSAPSNAQFGDAFVVVQWIGDAQDTTYLTVPTGWTKLQYEGGSHTLYSTDGKLTDSYYVALYVYGSQPNDTGQYEFKILPQVSGAETLGFLVAYRGASPNIPGNYKLYGKGATQDSTNVKTVTLSPQNNDSPAPESTLLSLFSQGCVGSDDPDLFVPFGSPSGTPALTVETPLGSTNGFFAADVGVPTGGGTYGLYKSTISCESLNTGISLVIPE